MAHVQIEKVDFLKQGGQFFEICLVSELQWVIFSTQADC